MRLGPCILQIVIAIAFLGCGEVEVIDSSLSNGEGCRADLDLPMNRKPVRMSLSADAQRLLVLDGYSGITGYHRRNYGCDWVRDSLWQSDGFIDELDQDADSKRYTLDGNTWGDESGNSCTLERGRFAMDPNGSWILLGTNSGVKMHAVGSGGCAAGPIIESGFQILGLDADAEGLIFMDAIAGNMPARLSGYDYSGSRDWTVPLSQNPSIEPYFCGVDRIRSSAFGIYAFDRTCGRILGFYRNGAFRRAWSLDSLGLDPASVLDFSLHPNALGTVEFLTEGSFLTIQLTKLWL